MSPELKLALAIFFVVSAITLLRWEIRSERKHKERVEAEDMADFETYAPRSEDWEFPPKWHPPTQEYVAAPKERVR